MTELVVLCGTELDGVERTITRMRELDPGVVVLHHDLRDLGRGVVHRRLREVSDAIRDIEQRSGRAARPAEIAARMKVTLDEYHKIVSDAARCQVFSIDETAVDDEGPRREPQGHAPGPMQLLEQAEFRGSLAEAIDDLPERERLIMALYYQDELNLREIGSILEVSESRVCQIHGQALTRLRARMAEHLQRPTAAAQRR